MNTKILKKQKNKKRGRIMEVSEGLTREELRIFPYRLGLSKLDTVALKMSVFLFAIFFSYSNFAERGSVILSGAVLANGTIENNDDNSIDDDLNFGAAALVEANINGYLGLESGLLLVNRRYVAEFAGFEASSEVLRLHVPIMFKFWPTNYFSLAAGPYGSFKVGDRKSEVNSPGGTTLGSFKTSADDSFEYGFEGAVTLNLPVYKKCGFFVEGRVLFPLNSEDEEDAREFLVLSGLKFDL